MKFSEQWLREWVSPELSTQQLADQVTMAGLEVDGIEPVAGEFSGVVVAEVKDKQSHPEADRLNVCQVDDGSADLVQVVCGAPNVAIGQKVFFARVGAKLPGDFKIRKAKLRGVESRGMICGASELGLEDDASDGIMVLPADAPIGHDAREWLNLDDNAIEVDLTPNRGDCLSVKGLAREVAVLNRLAVTAPTIAPVTAVIDDTFPVAVSAPQGCPRYLGRVVRGVNVAATSPLWLEERLRRSGIRSIDPVVDITNYVLLELGQPMHAFDLACLNGGIDVRMAKAEEPLTLLDGQEIALRDDTLVIADENGPLAIAGVMGGKGSGVSADTQDIFFEAAFFAPLTIAGKARSYGLHTDSSHRFERGVDAQLQRDAIERATALLIEIAGGQPGPVIEVASDAELPKAAVVSLSAASVERTLGMALPNDEIVEILERLGMQLTANGEGHWQVTVPSWRFDVSIEADLIEELARIHGYNNLPVSRPNARLTPAVSHEATQPLTSLRRQLVARGYQEAISYSFVAPEQQKALDPEGVAPSLANPISSDMAVMRSSLWPGLVKALSHNLNRQQSRVRLFETGLVFRGELDTLDQIPMVGGLISGTRVPEGWNGGREKVDFFDLKGDVEALLALGGNLDAWRFEAAEHPALHPGQSARLLLNGEPVGWMGALHPATRAELGLKVEVFVFEMTLAAACAGRLPRFAALSKYPEVRRDLAFVVKESVHVQSLLDAIRAQAGEWLTDLRLFDVYQGQGVADGHKSLALGLTWQHPSRTLNDDEINQLVDAIVTDGHTRFGAALRA